MIVGFQPGGTIKSARVVLRPDETLPNKFNTPEAEVYREDPDNGHKWVLIKPAGKVLPADSELLSNPEITVESILDLTIPTDCGNVEYEHIDIIKVDEETKKEGES